MSWKINVEQSKCIGCGDCMDACPLEVYEVKKGKAIPINADECIGCQNCVEVCGEEALSVIEK